MLAALGNLSFEGVTKRNKPDLKVRRTFDSCMFNAKHTFV